MRTNLLLLVLMGLITLTAYDVDAVSGGIRLCGSQR